MYEYTCKRVYIRMDESVCPCTYGRVCVYVYKCDECVSARVDEWAYVYTSTHVWGSSTYTGHQRTEGVVSEHFHYP